MASERVPWASIPHPTLLRLFLSLPFCRIQPTTYTNSTSYLFPSQPADSFFSLPVSILLLFSEFFLRLPFLSLPRSGHIYGHSSLSDRSHHHSCFGRLINTLASPNDDSKCTVVARRQQRKRRYRHSDSRTEPSSVTTRLRHSSTPQQQGRSHLMIHMRHDIRNDF